MELPVSREHGEDSPLKKMVQFFYSSHLLAGFSSHSEPIAVNADPKIASQRGHAFSGSLTAYARWGR